MKDAVQQLPRGIEAERELCLCLIGLTTLVRPGSFPLQNWRMCTTELSVVVISWEADKS